MTGSHSSVNLKETLKKAAYTTKLQNKPERSRRQTAIRVAIRELGKAKPKQIMEYLHIPQGGRRTFFRDLKALENKEEIEKQWSREDGEFYVITPQPNEPLRELIDNLKISLNLLTDWADLLEVSRTGELAIKEPIFPLGEGSSLIDLDLKYTKINDAKSVTKEIEETLDKIGRFSPNSPTHAMETKCPKCWGTVFVTTEDGREVCAKCALERKT